MSDDLGSVTWSPDGTRLAFGGLEKVLGVLTTEGRVLWRSEPHGDQVRWVAWSPDGVRIASASYDGTVRLWAAQDGRELRRVEERGEDEGCAFGVCWSPDGSRFAWGRYIKPYQLRVAGVAPGAQPRTLAELTEPVLDVTWSGDGRRLAVRTGSEAVRILDAASGAVLFSLGVPRPLEPSWSPDGRLLAVASEERMAQVWDADSERLLHTCRGHAGRVYSVCWSPDGRVLASGGNDRSVRLWSAQDGRELARLDGHEKTVWSVRFAPGGGLLASTGNDGTIRLWDVSDLVPVRPPDLAGSPERAYLARQAHTVGRAPRGAGVRDDWVPSLAGADPDTGCLGCLDGKGRSLDLLPGCRAVITADVARGQPLRRLDLAGGTEEWSSPDSAGGGDAWGVASTPDGLRIALAADRGLLVVDARSGDTLWARPEYRWVTGVAWSPSGDQLACGLSDGRVLVLDPDSGQVLASPTGARGRVHGVGWSADGRLLAAGSLDGGAVCVWDAGTGALLRTLSGPGSVWGIRWSPRGRLIAACESGRAPAVWVWDADTGREVARCLGHTADAYHAAWSPDGLLLASTSNDKTVRVWEAATGAPVRTFIGHTGTESHALAWSASGAFLASGGYDGVRLWDTRALLATQPVPPRGPADGALSTPRSLRGLPGALAAAHRLGLHPPLGLLCDLLGLTGGRAPAAPSALASLADHPGARTLAGLRWSEEARVGLAALLLSGLPLPDGWAPPPGLDPSRLGPALEAALADAEDAPTDPYPAPAGPLAEALSRLDDRLVALLGLVGPRAVAADPALPLRLARQAASLPQAVRTRPRPLTLGTDDADGDDEGAGSRPPRRVLGNRGPLKALVPWQLGLPADVLAARHRRGELLYRVGSGPSSGPPPPLVLVLDVSPACYGPVEGVTRAAAWAAGEHWLVRGGVLWVLACGERDRAWPVNGTADLAAVWWERSPGPASAVRALQGAGRLAAWLGGGARVLALAHPWFGWGEAVEPLPGLLGLFAHPHGGKGTPALAGACARWAVVDARGDAWARALPALLG